MNSAGAPRPRIVLHADMDAFYVSVELLRRPELAGRPVVVGGTGPRGVVAAASYEARRFGVHSALPSSVARRRCPQAVFLPGDHELYAEVSVDVRTIFDRYSPTVEPLALDEAFLDVSGAGELFGTGVEIARRIRADVLDELGLGCSVGVARNKFLAKLASVDAKPRARPQGVAPGRGVVAIEPDREQEYLDALPVERLWGVGPATLEKLHRVGVRRVADLRTFAPAVLRTALGAHQAEHLGALARGEDDRPVDPDRAVKSIGHEETYPEDRFDPAVLRSELVRLADSVAARLRHSGVGARTLTLKVRFAGFRTITRSTTAREPTDQADDIVSALGPVLAGIDVSSGVRLLGVSGSNLAPVHHQLSFDELLGNAGATQATSAAVDQIRGRFGADAIGPASAVGDRGIRVVRKGAQQWGPDS